MTYYGLDHQPIDAPEAERLLRDIDARRVATTEVGVATVSTVFLVVDHDLMLDGGGPVLYETMVFGGAHDQETWRYRSRVAALAGHDQAVAMLKAKVTTGGLDE